FFGGPNAIWPRPHLIARLGRDNQFIAKPLKVKPENFAKVLFGASVRRAVHVGEVEMRDTSVKGPADDRTAGLEDIDPAKILPHAERNRRQHEAALTTGAISDAGVTLFARGVHRFLFPPLFLSCRESA